jgi:hypothetical protein
LSNPRCGSTPHTRFKASFLAFFRYRESGLRTTAPGVACGDISQASPFDHSGTSP